MKVKKLKLQNFRNIKALSIDFDKEINVICGENAQGKTNIIEALWLFSGAKSFRSTNDSAQKFYLAKKERRFITKKNFKIPLTLRENLMQ